MPAADPRLTVSSFDACAASGPGEAVGFLRWPGLATLGVDAVVTTRAGGVSGGPYASLNLGLHVGDDPEAVVENRRRAAAALGASLDELVFGTQVHGTHAAVVGPDQAGRGARRQDDALPATDALVTGSNGPVLATLVADCSPILLVDPDARVLATVHAGWRGALRGVGDAAVAAMVSVGARVDRIRAVIGPTVSFGRYEVGPEVAEAAAAALGPRAADVLAAHGERWRFDVAGANRLRLLAAGLAGGNVCVSPCTTDDPRFFSDRSARPCGRFGLLARLVPGGPA
jgi:YfiH family protein